MRKPRKHVGRSSGGVAFYIHESLASSMNVLLRYSNGVVEGLVIYSSILNLVIVGVYHQPDNADNRSTAKEFLACLNEMTNAISGLNKSPEPDIILVGDFNLPNVCWNQNVCTGSLAEKRCYSVLNDLLLSVDLS